MRLPLLTTASAITVLFAIPSVFAQSSTGLTENSGPVLETITVTAQRREESLQDAAIPINAATGEELARVGVADATTLNKVAPSLSVVNGAGTATSYFVRGVGNFVNNGLADSPVAFNLDGVYLARTSASVGTFLDVDRVEILKGPQGTLYGRNATGGAINVIPAKPQPGVLEGNITAGYGNYDAYEVSGVVNIPIGDSTAIRLAAIKTEHDNYFDDGTGTAEDQALRAQVYTEFNDRFNARLSFDYATKEGTGPGVNVLGAYAFTPQIFLPPGTPTTIPNWTYISAPGSVSSDYTGVHTPETLAYLAAIPTPPLFTATEGFEYPAVDNTIWGVSAEFNIDLGGADLVIIPAYRESTLDELYNGPLFKAAIADDDYEQFSLESRISGSTGPVDWIGGAYYFEEEVTFDSAFNQFSVLNVQQNISETDSWAVFLRGTYNVSDKLRLVGAARYTEDERSIEGYTDLLAAVCVQEGLPDCTHLPSIPAGHPTLEQTVAALDPSLFPFGNPFTVPDGVPVVYGAIPGDAIMFRGRTVNRGDSSFDKLTYRLAVEYDVTPDSLVYASFETGFRSGGFNTTFGRETFDPEFIDAYTIGSKNRFLKNRLELNLEAFWWDYQDQQLSHIGLDLRGNNNFFTENIGQATIKGIEVDFKFAATNNTLITGSVQYLDATNDNFTYEVPNQNAPEDPPNFITPVTGCPYTNSSVTTITGDDVATYAVDCSGKPALNSPDWTANLGIQHTVNLGGFDLIGSLDGQYRSDRVLGFDYLPTGNSGDTFTADAMLTFTPSDGAWFVTAYVRNLTDESVPVNYQISQASVATSAYASPRTYGARIGINF